MRIAVGYFGIPRCSSISRPSVEQNILEPLRLAGEVREFYHLYQLDRVENPRSGEQVALGPEVYQPFIQGRGELEAPGGALERWNAARLLSFGNDFRSDSGDTGKTFENLIHQLASLHRLTELMEPWQPDVVAFVRPDLLYHTPWTPEAARRCSENASLIYIPEWQNWAGANDRMALCGSRAARAYGRRIELAESFCVKRHRPLHSERLVDWALERARAKVRYVSWQASRVRANGLVKRESFQRDRHSRLVRALLSIVRRIRDPLQQRARGYRAL